MEIKGYVMIDGQKFFDLLIINDQTTYDSIQKIGFVEGGDYTTSCLLDYVYFKKSYSMIAIDLSKQQTLDLDPRAVQQINLLEI